MTGTNDGGDVDLLREGCAQAGATITAQQEDKFFRFLDLLYVWNRAAGLTTIPRRDAVRLHVVDSLMALRAVPAGPCLDLGTGAGLPGLVLAIASETIEFVLVESNRRRSSFLLEAVRLLELRNVRLIAGAVESLPSHIHYPVVISRAFRPPAEFLALAAPLLADRGQAVALMADPSEDDLMKLERASGLRLTECRRFRLPGGGEARTVACFRAV